jgi:hypothetical protein
VLNREVYAWLCELKLRHEAAVGEPKNPDYFPLYRR